MTQFHVGQKVVCINDKLSDFRLPGFKYEDNPSLHGLTAGRLYTVRDVFVNPVTSQINVRLAEIIRPIGCNDRELANVEAGFHPDRFRPVVVRKTDISQFKAMLNPQKTEVTA